MSVQSSQAAGVPAPHNNRHRNEDNNHNENLHRHNDDNNHAHYVRFLFLTNDESYIDEKLYYSSELCSIYIVYILDVLVARTANFQRCQLAFCLRVVYVCFYSQLICIYYIDFLHCCNRTLNLLKRYATRTSTTYTATTRTITSTLPTTTTTTTTTRCLGVRPSHFLPFSFYTLYIYIREYIEIRVLRYYT